MKLGLNHHGTAMYQPYDDVPGHAESRGGMGGREKVQRTGGNIGRARQYDEVIHRMNITEHNQQHIIIFIHITILYLQAAAAEEAHKKKTFPLEQKQSTTRPTDRPPIPLRLSPPVFER